MFHIRFIAGFLVCAFGGIVAGTANAASEDASCRLSVDRLVARAGSAQISVVAPTTSEPALAAMGRLSVDDKVFSIWRIRNSTLSRRLVTLYSRDTLASARFDLAPHTDLFVRSAAISGIHVLLAGEREVESRPASKLIWQDARTIDDPLCSEPGTTLWVRRHSGLMRVSPIDGRVLIDIPIADSAPTAFAIDPVTGAAWAFADSQLRSFDLRGRQLIEVRLASFKGLSAVTVRLAVDSTHHVWVAAAKRLFRLSATGVVLNSVQARHEITQLAFDRKTNLLWAATASDVTAWPAGADQTTSLQPSLQIALGAVRLIAADQETGLLWVAAGDRLRAYDSSAQALLDVSLQAMGPLQSAEADSHGGLWLANAIRLLHYTETGAREVVGSPFAPLMPGITGLAVNQHTDALWLMNRERLWQIPAARSSSPLPAIDSSTTTAPQPGLLLPYSRQLEELRIFDDFTAPALSVESPVDNSILNIRRPKVQLTVNEDQGHVDSESFEFTINGLPYMFSCGRDAAMQYSCVPERDLADGANTLVVSVADDSENRSAPVRVHLTIDTIAPSVPRSDRIAASIIASELVQLVGGPGAAEAGAMVIARNSRSGVTADTRAQMDGSFVLSIGAGASDEVVLRAVDQAGNSSPSLAVSAPVAHPVLSLASPADGSTTADRDITVRGSVSGATTAGVTVNNIPVNLMGSAGARVFAIRIPLSPGANKIEVIARLADGSQLEARRSINLTNASPFGVRVSKSTGVAPLEVAFAINESEGRHASSVSYDFDGDGRIDLTTVSSDLPQDFSYSSPGEHVATAFVTDETGISHRYDVSLFVLSSEELDLQIRGVWHQFLDALDAKSVQGASSFLSTGAATTINAALQDLASSLPSISATLQEPLPNQINATFAEYTISRQIAGSNKSFLIYFRLEADGLWRIASF